MPEHQKGNCEIGRTYIVEVLDRMHMVGRKRNEVKQPKCLESFMVEVESSDKEETILRAERGCQIIASVEFMRRLGRVPFSVLRLRSPKSNEP